MICECGKSVIPDIKPNDVDIAVCPYCEERYHYIRIEKENLITYEIKKINC